MRAAESATRSSHPRSAGTPSSCSHRRRSSETSCYNQRAERSAEKWRMRLGRNAAGSTEAQSWSRGCPAANAAGGAPRGGRWGGSGGGRGGGGGRSGPTSAKPADEPPPSPIVGRSFPDQHSTATTPTLPLKPSGAVVEGATTTLLRHQRGAMAYSTVRCD